jgi:hypothetical protein
MTFEESYKLMGLDESFRATVYAMNTLLIQKGVYTSKEFEQLFCEHAITSNEILQQEHLTLEPAPRPSLSPQKQNGATHRSESRRHQSSNEILTVRSAAETPAHQAAAADTRHAHATTNVHVRADARCVRSRYHFPSPSGASERDYR